MSGYEHWDRGARAAYEEMSCLAAAGATGDEIDQIERRLTMAHGDNEVTPQERSRWAGYLQTTAGVAEQLLYQQDAARDAALEAGQ
jgi:truncated hemoglobin YjbI